MLFDPFTYLIARKRADKNNLSSRDAFKAALLGSVAGGGNVAAGAMIADRRIRNIARPPAIVAPPPGPADCVESLLGEIRRFIDCIGKADLDDKMLEALRESTRQAVENLKIDAKLKTRLKKQVDEACSGV